MTDVRTTADPDSHCLTGEAEPVTDAHRRAEPVTDAHRRAEPATDADRGAEPETRWLSGDELRTWVNIAQMLMLLPASLDRQLREDTGIPHAYYQILAMLSAEPERSMRMTDLARVVGSTTSRLSHAVASLEQRGWVERRACSSDKRGQIACLTDAGMSVLEAAAPGHVAEVRRLVFDNLTADDVQQLGTITAKLLPTLHRCG
ncbi:MarR family winged helix-turn-helix transcriptional regulator [Actinoplanes sp. GCM10030250]|uniref:MarR family winged helix-turn-helix transcriptional regulator n=1 Tax=Actinoplanes sp. GCM10030250 TaxID=3273376 RepID=UPI003607889F